MKLLLIFRPCPTEKNLKKVLSDHHLRLWCQRLFSFRNIRAKLLIDENEYRPNKFGMSRIRGISGIERDIINIFMDFPFLLVPIVTLKSFACFFNDIVEIWR
jgi:hypothetical protein